MLSLSPSSVHPPTKRACSYVVPCRTQTKLELVRPLGQRARPRVHRVGWGASLQREVHAGETSKIVHIRTPALSLLRRVSLPGLVRPRAGVSFSRITLTAKGCEDNKRAQAKFDSLLNFFFNHPLHSSPLSSLSASLRHCLPLCTVPHFFFTATFHTDRSFSPVWSKQSIIRS